jgi:signal transduction histidine kinase
MMKRYSAFVWATLLLAALIAVLAGWSLKNARATAYNSLRSQGEALAEAIERSALHGFRTEHLLGQQFLETFQNQVQQLDQQLGRAKDRDTQENLLQESVRRYRWDLVVVMDRDLKPVMGFPRPGDVPPPGNPVLEPSQGDAPPPGPGPHLGRSMGLGHGRGMGMGLGMGIAPGHRIRSFLQGPDQAMVLQGPGWRHPWGMEPYLVAFKRDNGQVLLARASLERMQEAFNPAGVQTLFRTLVLGKTILMVVLADEDNIIRFASDDAWLGKPMTELEGQLRGGPRESIQVRRALETKENEPTGQLLLALATEPALRQLAQTRRSVALMGMATFGVGLAGILAIAWIQQRSLRREERMQHAVTRSKRLAALGQMAGQVAHEIRNPLNAISLSLRSVRRELEAAVDTNQASAGEGYLDTAQSELQRLNRIVEDFLLISRFPPIQRQTIDLNTWLGEIVTFYGGPAHEAGIVIESSMPPQPMQFSLDPDQMRQAIGNLILNAIQASSPGSTIKVTLQPERRGIVIEIVDGGAGIAAEDLERVFELYHTSRPDGSGLGLPIALRIIEDHGGSLQLNSQPGHGTTARIFLPGNG